MSIEDRAEIPPFVTRDFITKIGQLVESGVPLATIEHRINSFSVLLWYVDRLQKEKVEMQKHYEKERDILLDAFKYGSSTL